MFKVIGVLLKSFLEIMNNSQRANEPHYGGPDSVGHVLHIEPDADYIELVAMNFRRAGIKVTSAAQGLEGLQLANKLHPDLILLETMLPELSGYDVIKLLKSNPYTQNIPIVVLSMKGMTEDRIFGLQLGAFDYIPKPFSPKELILRVTNYLRTFSGRVTGSVVPSSPMLVNPIFSNRAFAPHSDYCFILMPFHEPWSDRLWRCLKRVGSKAGFRCERADEIYGNNILEDIWTAMNSANVIIADVTSRNPNVMYEVGIAHTLGKSAILLTQQATDIPFDFRGYRHLTYTDDVDGFEKLETFLPNFLAERKESREQKHENKQQPRFPDDEEGDADDFSKLISANLPDNDVEENDKFETTSKLKSRKPPSRRRRARK